MMSYSTNKKESYQKNNELDPEKPECLMQKRLQYSYYN